MKAAKGQGIISSIVIQSDDLDEIDWEFMGGNQTTVQSNYFGKGNQTSFDRAVYHQVATPMDDFHNYTTHWTSEKIEWIVDGVVLRTLNYADANEGRTFPQTPSNVRLGIWAGGDPDNNKGTIEWAGGLTDYDAAPFAMVVSQAKITDYGTGQAYHWSDTSGSFQSIKSISGNSSVAETINTPPATPAPTIAEKWTGMSSGAKIGVYAGAGTGAAAAIGLIALLCVKQRRRGAAARAAEEARQEEQRRADAAYAGMNSKEQDQLPLNAMPTQYNEAKGPGYYANSVHDSDVGSINQYNMAGGNSHPSGPPVSPPIYNNTGFGSNGYVRANEPPPTYNNQGYASLGGSPSPIAANPNGFNFNPTAPSRSFSERTPGGYNSIPLGSPPLGAQNTNGYAPGPRSFSAAPQMNYPASQNRF